MSPSADLFLAITDPAFNPGEQWTSTDGSGITVDIDCVQGQGSRLREHTVYYTHKGVQYHKDAWSFQVRYEPASSRSNLREKFS